MDVQAKDVPAGRFFAVADKPPDNVYIMRIPPRYNWPKDIPGLCQNINDSSFWSIEGDRLVRLVREDEHDKTEFYV